MADTMTETRDQFINRKADELEAADGDAMAGVLDGLGREDLRAIAKNLDSRAQIIGYAAGFAESMANLEGPDKAHSHAARVLKRVRKALGY